MSVAVLVSEDGHVFSGRAVGARGEAIGQVIIDSSVANYASALAKPDATGHVVLFSSPHIGNVGVPKDFVPTARGLIVRELSRIASNWQSNGELDSALGSAGVVGIEGLDTRALVKLVAKNPGLRVGIFSAVSSIGEDVQEGERIPRDLVKRLTVLVKESK